MNRYTACRSNVTSLLYYYHYSVTRLSRASCDWGHAYWWPCVSRALHKGSFQSLLYDEGLAYWGLCILMTLHIENLSLWGPRSVTLHVLLCDEGLACRGPCLSRALHAKPYQEGSFWTLCATMASRGEDCGWQKLCVLNCILKNLRVPREACTFTQGGYFYGWHTLETCMCLL